MTVTLSAANISAPTFEGRYANAAIFYLAANGRRETTQIVGLPTVAVATASNRMPFALLREGERVTLLTMSYPAGNVHEIEEVPYTLDPYVDFLPENLSQALATTTGYFGPSPYERTAYFVTQLRMRGVKVQCTVGLLEECCSPQDQSPIQGFVRLDGQLGAVIARAPLHPTEPVRLGLRRVDHQYDIAHLINTVHHIVLD